MLQFSIYLLRVLLPSAEQVVSVVSSPEPGQSGDTVAKGQERGVPAGAGFGFP